MFTFSAGVDSGDTIRVPKAGNSRRRGGHPGNLIIRLKVWLGLVHYVGFNIPVFYL